MQKLTWTIIIVVVLAVPLVGQSHEARLIDAFGSSQCEDVRSRLDSFLAVLSESPNSNGYVFVYEGKYEVIRYKGNRPFTWQILPVLGNAASRTHEFRQHFKYRDFDPARYLFIDGGYRELHYVELWIVPKGATPPAAKPTLERMKFRTGKPVMVHGCP
jgi:hypothetical protein